MEPFSDCKIPARGKDYGGRRAIENSKGSMLLDNSPRNICLPPTGMGPLDLDIFASQLKPVATVLELEASPSAVS